MAFEKVLNTRIINKNADLSDWSTSTLKLKQGEIALAKFTANTVNPLDGSITSTPAYAIKVGQEDKTFREAAWLYAPASDVHAWAKKSALEYTDLPKTLRDEIDALQAAIGDNGSVATAIKNAIKALDVAESKDTDETNGGVVISSISETDGKISVTRRALTDADIADLNVAMGKVTGLADALDAKADKTTVENTFKNYRTSAAQDAIDGAQDTEIAKKADATQVATDIAAAEGRVDKKLESYRTSADQDAIDATFATKTALEGVDAKFANYKTAEAQKAIDDEQDRRLGVLEAKPFDTYATKTEVQDVADDLADYVESNDAAVADRYTKSEADAKFALITDAYDDTEVRGLISDNADAIADETERATGIEAGLRTDVDAIKGDYLKAADKTALEGKITAEETRAKGVEESLQTQINTIMNNPDAEGAINSINEFTQYIADHGEIADGFRADINKNKDDIAANAKAIADQATSDAATYATKTELANEKKALQDEIDADVKVVADDLAGYKTTNAAALDLKADKTQVATDIATAKSEAIADAAGKYETIGTAQGIVDGLKLSETYEPKGAEDRAKAYVDGKDFAGITTADITAWNNEKGAKALAETKTTTAEVKAQIEAYGYALDSRVTEVDNKFADYTKTADLETELDLTNRFAAKADKSVVDAMYTNAKIDELVAGAKSGAEATAAAALATARTQISAEIDTDVKVVSDDLAGYKTSNDAALAAVESTADSAVQTVSGATESGLKATKSDTAVTIDFDSECVFVFDCGNHQA